MGIEKVIPSELELVNIFGVNDNNLKYIKSMFPLLKINVRGNVIYIDGDKKEASEVLRILDEMVVMSANKEVIDQADVELLSKINTETKRNGRKPVSFLMMCFFGPCKAHTHPYQSIRYGVHTMP